jgi:hypothetical protein
LSVTESGFAVDVVSVESGLHAKKRAGTKRRIKAAGLRATEIRPG